MGRPVPAGPPPPPVAQRLVIRYAKRGRMRFASHRDIARAVERGVRRAGLPIAYSAGFSPHPRISYAGGAQTGTASEAEYLELAFTDPCTASDVRDRLDAALPSGIDVIEVLEMTSGPAAGGMGALGLEASDWEVTLPGVAPADAARAVEVFLGAGTAEVERLTSKGTRRVDARAAVVLLQAGWRAADERDAACAILRMVVRHLTPAVRPDDILTALRQLAGLAPSSPPLVTRLAQGPLGRLAAAASVPAPGLPGPAGSAGPDGAATEASALSGWGLVQGQRKTTRLGAVPADVAGAPASAYDQLLRGAEGPETDLRAREPDGRLPECSRSSHKIEKTTVTGLGRTARPLM
jgi:radical SAM-linked protein